MYKKGKISETVRIYQDNSASSASVGKFTKAYHTVVIPDFKQYCKCVRNFRSLANIFAQSGNVKLRYFFHVIPLLN